MPTVKLNRKRATGIVYELLIRGLSWALVEGDPRAAGRCTEILERFFSSGTPIAAERELVEAIRTTRGIPETVARSVLREVCQRASGIDRRALDAEKGRLILAINRNLGWDFFKRTKLDEYRLLGAIQVVLDSCRPGCRIDEAVAREQMKDGLVRYMATSPAVAAESRSVADPLVRSLLVKKFRERYGGLSGSQQALLAEQARSEMLGDPRILDEYRVRECRRIGQVLNSFGLSSEAKDDPVMMERLNEALARLGNGPSVEDVMLFQRLADEIEARE
jgi:hypothetical protein